MLISFHSSRRSQLLMKFLQILKRENFMINMGKRVFEMDPKLKDFQISLIYSAWEEEGKKLATSKRKSSLLHKH